MLNSNVDLNDEFVKVRLPPGEWVWAKPLELVGEDSARVQITNNPVNEQFKNGDVIVVAIDEYGCLAPVVH